MATSARFHWPSPRGFVSAYAQNLMAADSGAAGTQRAVVGLRRSASRLATAGARDERRLVAGLADAGAGNLSPNRERTIGAAACAVAGGLAVAAIALRLARATRVDG